MLKYLQFDINKTKKSNKFKIFIISFIIIILLVYNIYINNDTKDDVKIISTNSRRIINNLNNYTETMSDFMVSNINDIELTEIQNIRLSIDYFKELKEQEIKEKELKELKEKELKELKEQELKEFKQQELKEIREKAIKLIKSYIPEFNSLINLVSTHQIFNKYVGEVLDISCIKEMIKINSEEIFNKLINIDYDKLEVSFNYLDKNEEYYKNTENIITTHIYRDYDKNNQYYNYSHYIYKNFKENIIKNPIYKNIKDRLEIDYSYTEPNLTDVYNNKSKYFSKSLNDFIYKNYYINTDYYKKYYENFYNDTYYINYLNKNNKYLSIYLEFVLNNEIIINNPNPIEIYNKHPFKNICGISSMSLNRNVDFRSNYLYSESSNLFSVRYTPINNLEEIEKELNNDYISAYNDEYNYNLNKEFEFSKSFNLYNQKCNNAIWGLNKYTYELEKNKGSRMVKHNLTNNIPETIIPSPSYQHYQSLFITYYFIEKLYIDFPLISIYDEYEYIEKILNDYKIDIYNLPIIPPIKFM